MSGRVGRLHVLTDPAFPGGHAALARAAAAGGADVVQLRDKRPLATADLLALAAAASRAVGGDARLIVNDRVDVALAVGAAGVHLGAEDLPPAVARRILGPEALIGATANSLQRALDRAREPVDYLGVGPVYGTASKARPAPTLGVEGLAAVCAAVSLPVVAIGSILPERVAEVIAAGAHGIAVLSGVAWDPDPAEACARYVAALRAAGVG